MELSHSLSGRLGQRIAIVGTTGSGKTTLAAHLARLLGAPHIELDALHWGPNWTSVSPDIFREKLLRMIDAEVWVTDGNYQEVRDIIWGRADTLIWLDYPLPLILGRLFRRTLRRVVVREELWNGNRESWRGAFLSRDSLFVWALTTYRRRRKEYSMLLTQPAYQHLAVIHLTSSRQTKQWLSGFEEAFAPSHANTSPH